MPPKKKSSNTAAESKEPSKGKKTSATAGDTSDRDSGNEADNDDSDSEDSSPAEQPIKVNLYEPAALLHTLDEHTAKALSEEGFTEDFQYSNSKLLIGFLASAVALLGQLYPMPFPDSRWFLLGCVLTYFIASGVLQLIHYFFEANCIHISKTKPRKPAIVVRTKPYKFDTDYSLIFAYRENHYPAFAPNTFEKTLQINNYFDTAGVFLKSKFTADIRAVANEFMSLHPAPASSTTGSAGRRKQE